MSVRELTSVPRMLPLYARALAPMLPGASRLPWVAGGGGEVPDLQLTLADVRVDRRSLLEYSGVCGFLGRHHLPATYPHVLAFPLHMTLMTDRSFPFPAIGLVHVNNRIRVHRAVGVEEPLDLRVHATPLKEHAKGATFTIVTEVRVGEELIWEEHSTMLRRGIGEASAADRAAAVALPSLMEPNEWRLPANLGRRYARVSGDRNPIHLHALSARPFGFPRAIAHGMWTKARCLAALQATLPDAYTVQVSFRKPIFLPARVTFAQAHEHSRTSFAVRSGEDEAVIHLEGTVSR